MREKNREASAASAASSRVASLEAFLSATAMTPNRIAPPVFPRRHRGLYDVGGEAPVCGAQHLRVNLPIVARWLSDAGDD